uniref:Uncharacterized protein n=1 Tax=Glossina palpalis gambiensis TaxID=67801 RepID=A0A1B0BGR6_9MUSC
MCEINQESDCDDISEELRSVMLIQELQPVTGTIFWLIKEIVKKSELMVLNKNAANLPHSVLFRHNLNDSDKTRTTKVDQNGIIPAEVDTSNRLVNDRGSAGSNVDMEKYKESNNCTHDAQNIKDLTVQERMSKKIKVVFKTALVEFENVGAEIRPTIARLYPSQKVSNVVTVLNTCLTSSPITHTTKRSD